MNAIDTAPIARTHTGLELLEVAIECGLLNSPGLTGHHTATGSRMWLGEGEEHAFSVEQENSGHYTVRDTAGEPVFGLREVETFVAAVEGALEALHAERTAEGYLMSADARVAELRSFGVQAKAIGEGTLLFVQPNAAEGDVSMAMRNREFPWLWDVAVANGDEADAADAMHAVEWADVVAIASECAF